jgi:twinkle protein
MEGKKFRWIGDVSDIELFGQHLWAAGGKRLTITEGELDALAVSQMQENKWPVVSIPSGAESAEKYIKLNLEWVESFETVVFAFDMDEPGKRAAGKCAALLSPGKARIANLPAKDGNECLLKGLTRDCITALWQASPYRPDGILAGADLWESIVSPVSAGYSIQFPELNHMLRGVRGGELCLFTAGSGIGKSTLVNEIAYHLHHEHGLPIGVLALEESPGRNALRYLGIHLNKPLHLPEARGAVSDDELRGAFDAVLTNGWYVYNHFGSSDTDTLLSKIRYMVVGLGCKVIVLDHISIVISGLEQTGVAGDERRTIDILMTRLRKLVEETGMILLAVVHLKRPPDGGKAYNEGRKVSLSDLRGSGSLEQLSDAVVALERDQQGEKPNLASIRVLKNRTVGVCGFAGEVEYTPETGRLLPVVAGEMGKADECPFSPEEEGAEMEERGKALIGDF